MCLTINGNFHPLKRVARVAAFDMLVYKGLDDITSKGGESPYQYFRYHFGETYESGMAVRGSTVNPAKTMVDAGLHACTDPSRARYHSNTNQYAYGIIPKGTKFYYGTEQDIVAEKLVVYRTLEDALQGRTLGQPDPSAHALAGR